MDFVLHFKHEQKLTKGEGLHLRYRKDTVAMGNKPKEERSGGGGGEGRMRKDESVLCVSAMDK